MAELAPSLNRVEPHTTVGNQPQLPTHSCLTDIQTNRGRKLDYKAHSWRTINEDGSWHMPVKSRGKHLLFLRLSCCCTYL